MFNPFFKNKNIDLKNVTNLDVTLDKLNNNQLFDLGYIVLFESLLAIRTLTSEIEDSYIWIKMITNATHNIPLKLKESDISFLKEEISKAITILYNLASSKLGKVLSISAHKIVSFFKDKGFNCTY